MIRAQVLGMGLTMNNLQKLEREAGVSMKRMIKDLTFFAAESAVKWSPPAAGQSYNKMKTIKKHTTRPIVKGIGKAKGRTGRARNSARRSFTYVKQNNQMFSTTKKIKTKDRAARGLVEVTQSVKFWSKKGNRWAYAPVNPRTGKPNKRNLRTGLRIPGAGAIKVGWMHASKAIGHNLGGAPQIRATLGSGKLTSFRGLLNNKVSYGAKQASHVPRKAEQLAWKRLIGKIWPQHKKRLRAMKL